MQNENQTTSTIPTEDSVPSSVEKKAPIATESGHWYKADGSPFYTVKAKNGNERQTTLADARKVGAVPSVTTITGILASPGLNSYFERQIFDAVLSKESGCDVDERLAHHDPDALFSEVREISREHSRAAAERGTSLHGAIERYLLGENPGAEWEGHIEALVATLGQHSISLVCGEPEKSFAHEMGFGGKVDFHDRANEIVLDFKSKPAITPGKRYGYDNHAMQLAAYSMGLGMPYARGINVFIGIEDKKVLVHEWSDSELSKGWCMFSFCLKLWQITKDYCPRKEEAA
jgi:hypothetical protein